MSRTTISTATIGRRRPVSQSPALARSAVPVRWHDQQSVRDSARVQHHRTAPPPCLSPLLRGAAASTCAARCVREHYELDIQHSQSPSAFLREHLHWTAQPAIHVPLRPCTAQLYSITVLRRDTALRVTRAVHGCSAARHGSATAFRHSTAPRVVAAVSPCNTAPKHIADRQRTSNVGKYRRAGFPRHMASHAFIAGTLHNTSTQLCVAVRRNRTAAQYV